jgi:hypothetical protein
MAELQGYKDFILNEAKKKKEAAPDIKPGDTVRSFDFPGSHNNCYIEGKVTHSDDLHHYIDVEKCVHDGMEKFDRPKKVRAPKGAHAITGVYGVQKIDQLPKLVNNTKQEEEK